MSSAYHSFPKGLGFTPRRHDRSTLTLPAVVNWDGQDHSAQILNVGTGGALIDCAAPAEIGTSLLLRCGSINVHADMVWTNGTLAGLRFHSALSERDLSDLRARSEAIIARRPRQDPTKL